MEPIKSYHNAQQNLRELITVYAMLIEARKTCCLTIQMDTEDNYYTVKLNNNDGTEFDDFVVCQITNSIDPDYKVTCLDDIEALVKISALLGHDKFREAWIECI